MSARGTVRHNSVICSLPLNEHTGNEACLEWVEEEDEKPIPVTVYKNGPQGNQVVDYHAEWLLHRQPLTRDSFGTPGISDRRDNSDPEAVGREHLGREKTITIPEGVQAFPERTEIRLTEKQGWVEGNGA